MAKIYQLFKQGEYLGSGTLKELSGQFNVSYNVLYNSSKASILGRFFSLSIKELLDHHKGERKLDYGIQIVVEDGYYDLYTNYFKFNDGFEQKTMVQVVLDGEGVDVLNDFHNEDYIELQSEYGDVFRMSKEDFTVASCGRYIL